MRREEERINAYLNTVKRLEPDITPIDASAFYASTAISLKRIADAMTETRPEVRGQVVAIFADIFGHGNTHAASVLTTLDVRGYTVIKK